MLESLANDLVVRMEEVAEWFSNWIQLHLINILIIVVGAWIFRRVSVELIGRLLKRTVRPSVYPTKSDREKRIKTLHSLANGIIRLAVYIIATVMIVSEINPSYKTILFTSAGLVGVALGFGAQSLIRDIVSGVFIIIENQYRIGDEISLAAGAGIGSVDGIVENITIRTTVLRDLNGNVHHMPNGNIGVTSNKTLGYSRMNENIVVAIETNLVKLESIIQEIGADLKVSPTLGALILEAPTMVSVKGFSEGGVIVRVSAKTTAASQWKVRSEFYKRLKKAFEKEKIKLAGQSQTSEDED